MSIRAKVLGSIVIFIVVLIVGLRWAVDHAIVDGVRRSEAAGMASTVQHVLALVRIRSDDLSSRFNDWSQWDDMLQFAIDANPEFYKSNINPATFSNVDADFMVVAHADGREVIAVEHDRRRSLLVPLDPEVRKHLRSDALLRGTSASMPAFAGLIGLTDGVYVVSSLPITHSSGEPGPEGMRLVVGRRIGKAWVERLRKFTSLDIDFDPLSQPPEHPDVAVARAALTADAPWQVTPLTDDEIAGYGLVEDFYGAPVASLRIASGRPTEAQAHEIVAACTLAMVLGGLVLLLMTTGLLSATVLRPLGRIQRAVTALRSGSHVEVAHHANDELGALAEAFDGMASALVRRARDLAVVNASLDQRLEQLGLVLDNVDQGFLLMTADGTLVSEPSRIVETWFGHSRVGMPVCELLGNQDQATEFRLAFQAVFERVLPTELAIAQIPQRWLHDGRYLSLEARPLTTKDGSIDKLVLIIRDVSDSVEAELHAAEQGEVIQLLEQVRRDARGFAEFLDEGARLVARLHAGAPSDPGSELRDLHTLKSNALMFGFTRVSTLCDALEQWIVDHRRPLDRERRRQLDDMWFVVADRARRMLDTGAASTIELTAQEHAELVAAARDSVPRAELVARLEALSLERADDRLTRIAKHTIAAAERLGFTAVEVRSDGGGLRLPVERLRPFWTAFAHVVRNTVAHAIESPELRAIRGKPPTTTIAYRTREEGGALIVEVSDDGPGFDWPSIAARTRARGLPFATREDLIEALLGGGISTRGRVTEASGRGMGLSAIATEVALLGGRVEVDDEWGGGSTIRFRLPHRGPPRALPQPPMLDGRTSEAPPHRASVI